MSHNLSQQLLCTDISALTRADAAPLLLESPVDGVVGVLHDLVHIWRHGGQRQTAIAPHSSSVMYPWVVVGEDDAE